MENPRVEAGAFDVRLSPERPPQHDPTPDFSFLIFSCEAVIRSQREGGCR